MGAPASMTSATSSSLWSNRSKVWLSRASETLESWDLKSVKALIIRERLLSLLEDASRILARMGDDVG